MKEWDGTALRRFRKARGWTQQQLASLIGENTPRGSVARWELGYLVPSWPTACAIADALGVKVDDLMKEKENHG